jgi:hydrogenase maturation protease
MSHALIIGYGNPLRGDDGVGWTAAEILAARTPELTVITRHQLTPELAETISHFARVVFVDATAVGDPGDIVAQPLDPASASGDLFSHNCDPAGLLHMARMLYGSAPTGHIVTVTGESFGYEETLSATVTAALPQLCAQIEKLIL